MKADTGITMPEVKGEVMIAPREGKGLIMVEYGAKPANITLSSAMTDLLTGRKLGGKSKIDPYGVLVLKDESTPT